MPCLTPLQALETLTWEAENRRAREEEHLAKTRSMRRWKSLKPPMTSSRSLLTVSSTGCAEAGGDGLCSGKTVVFLVMERRVAQAGALRANKELAERVLVAMEDVNQQPVVHTWSHKLESARCHIKRRLQ